MISTVCLYDQDNIGGAILWGGEDPVKGRSEVTVWFELDGNFSAGEYHYYIDGYTTPTTRCSANSKSFTVN